MNSLFYGFGPATASAEAITKITAFQKQLEFLAWLYDTTTAEVENILRMAVATNHARLSA